MTAVDGREEARAAKGTGRARGGRRRERRAAVATGVVAKRRGGRERRQILDFVLCGGGRRRLELRRGGHGARVADVLGVREAECRLKHLQPFVLGLQPVDDRAVDRSDPGARRHEANDSPFEQLLQCFILGRLLRALLFEREHSILQLFEVL